MAGVNVYQNLPKERSATKRAINIIALRQPEPVDEPLTEIAPDGAPRISVTALRAQADAFVTKCAEEVLPNGR